MPKHIHDHAFRAAMTDPRVARDLFISHYPPQIIAKIDLDTLTLCQETFVDEIAQNKLVVDVLYKAKFREGEKIAYLYLLTEAQAEPDPLMPWRIVKYTIRIIEYHLKATESKVLPVVLPLVVYHGKKTYNYSTNIFELFNDPALAKAYMFNDINLLDLSKMADEAMLQSGYAGLMMGVMHHAKIRDLYKMCLAIAPFIKIFKYEKRYLQIMLMYALNMSNVKNRKEFFTIINTLEEPVKGEIMNFQQFVLQEGIEKGEQNLFLRLLKRKFSNISNDYLQLVNKADEEKLLNWGEKILYANKIEEVFS